MTAPDPPPWIAFADLPSAHGGPVARGRLRVRPEDFCVDEIRGFQADGEGEHLLLRVRKTGLNTADVARRLAMHAGVPAAAVSYAGRKDRYAVTTQWFSVHTGVHLDPDWSVMNAEGVEVLTVQRHRRKLRRGALRGNRFAIRVRALEADPAALADRIGRVGRIGVPNYFGAQRFGNREGNLHAAHALFTGGVRRAKRHLRGLWLSAARSQIFNEVLARRVKNGDWDRPRVGDRMQLSGSHASFLAEALDDELMERCTAFGIHPSGPLWGAGELPTRGEVAAVEREVAEKFQAWTAGLAAAGLRQERRPLRVTVGALEAKTAPEHVLEIRFELPAGAYATAVLRELVAPRH
jgi:tRNA pseudouridine13 synthase